MRYTPEFITELKANEIFVFGSNLSGFHRGGAAKQTMKWGAEWGLGVGLQGSTYAIPTMSEGIGRTLTLWEIKPYVDDFISFTKKRPDLIFLVTKIGCGIAGHLVENMANLFREAIEISNIVLPVEFHQ